MYEESGEKAIYIEKVMEYIRRTVADMQMLMEKADQICMEPDGPYMYGEMLEADQKVLRKLFAAKSYEEMYEALKEKPAWKTLSRKKDDAVDPTKREQVRPGRNLSMTFETIIFSSRHLRWKQTGKSAFR